MIARTRLAVLTASLALGCASAPAPSTVAGPETASEPSEPRVDPIRSWASRPEAPRVVLGPWERERIGPGDWIAGIGAIDGRIVAVVRTHGETRVMARDASGWTTLRDDYDAPATFVSTADDHFVVTDAASFRSVSRDRASFSGPCSSRPGFRAVATATDVWLVHSCTDGEVVEVSRRRDREWDRTPLPALYVRTELEAAVEGDGTVHVIGAGPPEGDYRGALRHYVVDRVVDGVVDGSGAREASFPSGPPRDAWLASCDGSVHALLKNDQRTALAAWDGARWRIGRDEPIAWAFVTGFVLDATCHPFIVAGGLMEEPRIFSYGRDGWVASAFASGNVTSPRALVTDDAVHVAYAMRNTEGDMEAWMASARVGEPER